MGLCFGTSSRPPSPSPPPQLPPPLPPPPGWTDLPTDLAGLIFSSLPSHHDRLSFLAVCSQWRLGALRQHPLPPVMPWLLTLSEPYVYQSLPDGEVRLVPDRWGSELWCLSSYGSWLLHFGMPCDRDCVVSGYGDHCYGRYFLKNPFSNATMDIDIPCHFDQPINIFTNNRHSIGIAASTFRKVVVCSPDLVVATVCPNKIVSFRPGIDRSWSVLPCHGDDNTYQDIALYRGKLYVLTSKEELLVHEIRDNSMLSHAAEHVIMAGAAESPLTHIEEEYNPDYIVSQYLVISCSGKLLMFRGTISSMVGISADVNSNAIEFKAFEADLEGGQWLEVKNLDGQVIFLSKASPSKAIRFSDQGGPRFGANCIFFLGADLTIMWSYIYTRITSNVYQEKEGVPLYGVYDFRTSKTNLISLGVEHEHPTMVQWFFPCM